MTIEEYRALIKQYPNLTLCGFNGTDLDRAELFDPDNIRVFNLSKKYMAFALPFWKNPVGVTELCKRIKIWGGLKALPPWGIVILAAYKLNCPVQEISFGSDTQSFYQYGGALIYPAHNNEDLAL